MMNPEDQRTSCPGFLDEYGVWNNGFECPQITGQIRICCGSESRRYCCTLENLHKPSSNSINRLEKNSYSTSEPSLFVTDTKTSSTILTLPIVLTFILILIIIFLLILLSLFLWYRYRNRHNQRNRQNNLTTKTNLLVDHFPFSPPHHQFFLNENNSSYTNNTSLLHQQTKDSLTTTTNAPSTTTSTSSTSGRIPSDIYFNDWKDFLIAGEQPMNIYPTMSSHSNELNNDHQYHHSNYLYHGKRQPYDVIV
jgi:hypothetical protein